MSATKNKSWQGWSFENDFISRWQASLFLAIAIFYSATVLRVSQTNISAVDITFINFASQWREMGNADPWPILGFLLALIMVPLTLFISVVLSNRDPNRTEWQKRARTTALNALKAASWLSSSLAWLCLPAVCHWSIAPIGLPLLITVTFLASIFGVYSLSEDGLTEIQNRGEEELRRLEGLREDLEAKAKARLNATNKSASMISQGHRLTWMLTVIISCILVTFWLVLGYRFGVITLIRWRGELLPLVIISFQISIAHHWMCRSAFEQNGYLHRLRAWLIFIDILWTVCIASIPFFGSSPYMCKVIWIALGLGILPAAAGLFWLYKSTDWFPDSRLRAFQIYRKTCCEYLTDNRRLLTPTQSPAPVTVPSTEPPTTSPLAAGIVVAFVVFFITRLRRHSNTHG